MYNKQFQNKENISLHIYKMTVPENCDQLARLLKYNSPINSPRTSRSMKKNPLKSILGRQKQPILLRKYERRIIYNS